MISDTRKTHLYLMPAAVERLVPLHNFIRTGLIQGVLVVVDLTVYSITASNLGLLLQKEQSVK